MPDVGPEHLGIDGAVDEHGRGRSRDAQGGYHGGGRPVSTGGVRIQALSAQHAAMQPRQVGFRPAFIDEYEALEWNIPCTPTPPSPLGPYVPPVLLRGVQRFFFGDSPSA